MSNRLKAVIIGAFLVLGITMIALFFWASSRYQIVPRDSVPVATQAVVIESQEDAPVIASEDQEADDVADANQQPEPPSWADTLFDNNTIIGYTYPLGMEGPWHQSVPEGGFVLVTCGNCTVDGKRASSDGTQGNVFLLIGNDADGSTPADLNETIVIDDYTPGHIQVTFIYAGNEVAREAGLSAVANMFGEPNCGQEGCVEVTLYSRFWNSSWDTEVFIDPPN